MHAYYLPGMQVHGNHSSAGVQVAFQQTLYMINESSSDTVMVLCSGNKWPSGSWLKCSITIST